jgi:hypothetical protein
MIRPIGLARIAAFTRYCPAASALDAAAVASWAAFDATVAAVFRTVWAALVTVALVRFFSDGITKLYSDDPISENPDPRLSRPFT